MGKGGRFHDRDNRPASLLRTGAGRPRRDGDMLDFGRLVGVGFGRPVYVTDSSQLELECDSITCVYMYALR